MNLPASFLLSEPVVDDLHKLWICHFSSDISLASWSAQRTEKVLWAQTTVGWENDVR